MFNKLTTDGANRWKTLSPAHTAANFVWMVLFQGAVMETNTAIVIKYDITAGFIS